MALGFISGATGYEMLTDEQVRTFLEDRCKESKETITISQLDKMVRYQLRTDMNNKNATARMKDLFTSSTGKLPHIATPQRVKVANRR